MSIRGDSVNSVIYNPLEEFESKYRELHLKNASEFFESLVQQSGIDIEQNRETVRVYNGYKENIAELKKKVNKLRFWRVIMCITILLIPFVIKKTTPKIKELRKEIEEADQRADAVLEEANRQMNPLNALFKERDSI